MFVISLKYELDSNTVYTAYTIFFQHDTLLNVVLELTYLKH